MKSSVVSRFPEQENGISVKCLLCGTSVAPSYLPAHEKVACSKRTVRCLRCKESILLSEFTKHERQCAGSVYLRKPRRRSSRLSNGSRSSTSSFLSFQTFIESPMSMANIMGEKSTIFDINDRCFDLSMEKNRHFQTHESNPQESNRNAWTLPEEGQYDISDMEKMGKNEKNGYNRNNKILECGYWDSKTKCSWCSQLFEGSITTHEASCPQKLIQCKLCQSSIPFSTEQVHMAENCLQRLVTCKSCGKRLRHASLSSHKSQSCSQREVGCPQCSMPLPFSELRKHLQEGCAFRLVECDQCGREDLQLSQYEHHLSSECPLRLVPCPYKCEAQLPFSELEGHTGSRCPLRPTKCLRCEAVVAHQDLGHHQATDCAMRPTSCHRCSRMIPAALLAQHMNEKCQMLEVKCPDCFQEVPRSELEHHCRWVCLERGVACSKCGTTVRRSELPHHEQTQCPQRCVKCPDCGEVTRAALLAEHRETLCQEQLVACPNGCGQEVRRGRRESHAGSSECPLATYECRCRATVLLAHRRDHLLVCPAYKKAWKIRLTDTIKQIGPKEVSCKTKKIVVETGVLGGIALCGLIESGGDIDLALSKMQSQSYVEEMELASNACQAYRFVRRRSSQSASLPGPR